MSDDDRPAGNGMACRLMYGNVAVTDRSGNRSLDSGGEEIIPMQRKSQDIIVWPQLRLGDGILAVFVYFWLRTYYYREN